MTLKLLASAVLAMIPVCASAQIDRLQSVSDGRFFASSYIQNAIDECSANGGGDVVIPAGTYLCKTLVMKSHVNLVLSRGARILGSQDYRNDYTGRALILADKVEDFAIMGEGMVDGNSEASLSTASGYYNNDKVRPYGILCLDCKDFKICGIEIRNAGFWTLRIRRCEKLLIDGIRIRSLDYYNNDGIDLDAKDARICNCLIDAEDDGICLKSDDRNFIPENITITNCVVSSNCNPIKFGTASRGGFRNVTISNCVIRPATESNIRNISRMYRNVPDGTISGMGGISIECVDGGLVENVSISNISMTGVLTPVFICLNKRGGAGIMRNINVSHIEAEAEGVLPCMVCGISERKIENVSFSDFNIIQRGGKKYMKGQPREADTTYPENRMYGPLNPACGLFLRHVDGFTADNIRIRLKENDERPCIVTQDVTGAQFSRISYFGTSGKMLEER